MIFPIVLDKRDSSRRRPLIRFVASSPTLLLSPIAHLSYSTKTHVCTRNGLDSVEITLQFSNANLFAIHLIPFKNAFVTFSSSISYRQARKRRPFTLQKGVFYIAKGALLRCKRICIAIPSMIFPYIQGTRS